MNTLQKVTHFLGSYYNSHLVKVVTPTQIKYALVLHSSWSEMYFESLDFLR